MVFSISNIQEVFLGVVSKTLDKQDKVGVRNLMKHPHQIKADILKPYTFDRSKQTQRSISDLQGPSPVDD